MPPPSPPEPGDLDSKPLPTTTVETGESVFRIQPGHYEQPLYFGRQDPDGRFNSRDGTYGICYLANSRRAAFAETIGRDNLERQAIPLGVLKSQSLIRVELRAELRLVPLHGNNFQKIGADASVTAGINYSVSKKWARAIYDHFGCVDGLRYRSRHDDDVFSIAVFERWNDESNRSCHRLGSLYENTEFLEQMIQEYSLDIVGP